MPKSLIYDRRGVSVVEFAIVIIPLMVTICGLLEVGYQIYLTVLVRGATDQAARSIITGATPLSDAKSQLINQLAPLTQKENITVAARNFRTFSSSGSSEKLVDDRNGNGRYDAGDCFIDDNKNGIFDSQSTVGSEGQGGANDVLVLNVIVNYRRIMPVANLIGMSEMGHVAAQAVVRNEPYAESDAPRTVCA